MSIVDGLHEIIDHFFGVEGIGRTSPHYGNISSCKKLSENPPVDLNVTTLLEELYQQIMLNWENREKSTPSTKNWRYEKVLCVSPENKFEVGLERRIVKCTDDSWVNQVPTIAGIVKYNADSRRAIDLVHRLNPGEYEFVELKIEADTPLFAAMEVNLYGLFYVFYRMNSGELISGEEIPDLLKGKAIHLKVLAPQEFYDRYELKWIEMSLNEGWKEFLKSFEELNIQIYFQFEVLPLHDFSDTLNIPCLEILRALDQRVSLYVAE